MQPMRTRSTLILPPNDNRTDATVDIFICDAVSKEPIPPHVVLAYNGRKRAYGRERLASLDITEIEQLFKEDFQIPVVQPWIGKTPQKSLLHQGFFITFHRTHGDGDRGSSLMIDPKSWNELLRNMTKIELEKPEPRKVHWPLIVIIVAFLVLLLLIVIFQ